jgi:hypothetical protein
MKLYEQGSTLLYFDPLTGDRRVIAGRLIPEPDEM